MTENARKFMEKVSADESLVARLSEINEKYPDLAENKAAFIAFAKELGTELTEEDLAAEPQGEDLADEELATVAGGRLTKSREFMNGVSYSLDCGCFMGGGGVADDKMKTCACVFGGAGYCRDNFNDGKRVMCCVVGGGGGDIFIAY